MFEGYINRINGQNWFRLGHNIISIKNFVF